MKAGVREPGTTMEVHFKLFGTDGVSLQSQELTKALRKRGWEVHPCASDLPEEADGLRLSELSYQSDDALALRGILFPSGADDDRAPPDLLEQIECRASRIRQSVEDYLDQHRIRLVHIRNIMSLPYNLPATLAFYQLITERPDIGFILQHHDLYWEGPNARSFQTPHPEVASLIEKVTCPNSPNTTHVLINPIAAEALLKRRGIHGVVVPDGFDFDRDETTIDDEAFRSRLAILTGECTSVTVDDLVVAMPARVASNKAIELSIQFVAEVDRRRPALEASPDGLGLRRRMVGGRGKVVLAILQGEDLGESQNYFDSLVGYAREMGITLAFGGDIVVPDRRFTPGDTEHYPFYSTYQAIDLVCYSPEHEGFGNQAIEAVWAKRPLIALQYPVFKWFVSEHIPSYISLGNVEDLGRLQQFGGLHLLNDDVLQSAVDLAVEVLKDHDLENRWIQENVVALRQFCGIDIVCERYIRLYANAAARQTP